MDIVIDISRLEYFFNLPAEQMLWVFFSNVGWLILAAVFLYGVREAYLMYIRLEWEKTHKNILLAIDIPRGNEQTPKAVENMFTYLAGAHGSINFFEKWFEGKFQKSFSYEVVSLEGYTQFLIRTPLEFRNLVESSVYSQYPDAEIAEVDDYVEALPAVLPDEEYDLWGTEFQQKDHWAFPIKVYSEFEHMIGPSEMQFKDPMASLMDLCSSLRQGEQLWFQIIVIPIGFDWIKECEKAVDKILGRKGKSKPGVISKLVEWMGEASELIYSIWGDIEGKEKADSGEKKMLELTPLEKRKAEAAHHKSTLIAFEAKIRMVYVARRDVINKGKVANGIVGYMKQFASPDLNNLKPDLDLTMTKAQYFFQNYRVEEKKKKIYQAYIRRSDNRGLRPGLFNIEELATLWHFPMEAGVKSSLVQKAPGRKADAPSALPLEELPLESVPDIFSPASLAGASAFGNQAKSEFLAEEEFGQKAAQPPENLPFA